MKQVQDRVSCDFKIHPFQWGLCTPNTRMHRAFSLCVNNWKKTCRYDAQGLFFQECWFLKISVARINAAQIMALLKANTQRQWTNSSQCNQRVNITMTPPPSLFSLELRRNISHANRRRQWKEQNRSRVHLQQRIADVECAFVQFKQFVWQDANKCIRASQCSVTWGPAVFWECGIQRHLVVKMRIASVD